jgi:hypothetical protein
LEASEIKTSASLVFTRKYTNASFHVYVYIALQPNTPKTCTRTCCEMHWCINVRVLHTTLMKRRSRNPHHTQDIAPDTWQALDSLTFCSALFREKGWRSISPDLGRLVPFRQIGFLEHGSVHLLLATMAGWTLGGRGMVGIWFARKRRLCMVSRIIVIAAWGAQMNVNTYAE